MFPCPRFIEEKLRPRGVNQVAQVHTAEQRFEPKKQHPDWARPSSGIAEAQEVWWPQLSPVAIAKDEVLGIPGATLPGPA